MHVVPKSPLQSVEIFIAQCLENQRGNCSSCEKVSKARLANSGMRIEVEGRRRIWQEGFGWGWREGDYIMELRRAHVISLGRKGDNGIVLREGQR